MEQLDISWKRVKSGGFYIDVDAKISLEYGQSLFYASTNHKSVEEVANVIMERIISTKQHPRLKGMLGLMMPWGEWYADVSSILSPMEVEALEFLYKNEYIERTNNGAIRIVVEDQEE